MSDKIKVEHRTYTDHVDLSEVQDKGTFKHVLTGVVYTLIELIPRINLGVNADGRESYLPATMVLADKETGDVIQTHAANERFKFTRD